MKSISKRRSQIWKDHYLPFRDEVEQAETVWGRLYCTCADFVSAGDVYRAWSDCPNCFGYGFKPIPEQDLGIA